MAPLPAYIGARNVYQVALGWHGGFIKVKVLHLDQLE